MNGREGLSRPELSYRRTPNVSSITPSEISHRITSAGHFETLDLISEKNGPPFFIHSPVQEDDLLTRIVRFLTRGVCLSLLVILCATSLLYGNLVDQENCHACYTFAPLVAYAQPPGIPIIVRGSVTLNGNVAPDGVPVVAKVAGEVRASALTASGQYDLTISGSSGEVIDLYVGTLASGQHVTFDISQGGVFENVNLSVTDTTPPTMPQNLRLTGYADVGRPNLAWDPSSDDVAVQSYKMKVDSQPDLNLGNVAQWTPASPLAVGVHQFSVKAVDVAGNQGQYSSPPLSITITSSTTTTSSSTTSTTSSTTITSSTTTTSTATSAIVSSTVLTTTTLSPVLTQTTLIASTTVTTVVTLTTTIGSGGTVTALVQGLVMQVSSNSSVSNLVFDSSRGLLNFTVSGPSGSNGFFDAAIAKSLLSGQPIVLIDGVEHQASVSSDANFWYIHATYPHSEHHITIGGSNTVPEFPLAPLLAIALVLALVAVRRKPRR